jgi:poly(A) polymerase
MYKNYLMVTVSAKDEDDYKKWEGWAGSRTKILIQNIENCTGGQMLAHPGTGKYKDPERDEACHHIFFLGLFSSPLKKKDPKDKKTPLNLNPAVENWQMQITSWMDRTTGESNWIPGMQAQVKHLKKKDLPLFLQEEINSYVKDVYVPETAKNIESDGASTKRKNGALDEADENAVATPPGEDSSSARQKDAAATKKKKKKDEDSILSAADEHDDLFHQDHSGKGAAANTSAKGLTKVGAAAMKVTFAQVVSSNTGTPTQDE